MLCFTFTPHPTGIYKEFLRHIPTYKLHPCSGQPCNINAAAAAAAVSRRRLLAAAIGKYLLRYRRRTRVFNVRPQSALLGWTETPRAEPSRAGPVFPLGMFLSSFFTLEYSIELCWSTRTYSKLQEVV